MLIPLDVGNNSNSVRAINIMRPHIDNLIFLNLKNGVNLGCTWVSLNDKSASKFGSTDIINLTKFIVKNLGNRNLFVTNTFEWLDYRDIRKELPKDKEIYLSLDKGNSMVSQALNYKETPILYKDYREVPDVKDHWVVLETKIPDISTWRRLCVM